jgi:PIN domain nuclease of toxin-antitoxin system
MTGLLLDTCAIIFSAENLPIEPEARARIRAANLNDGVFVSPVSAWEIGLLAAKKRINFRPDPATWFKAFLNNPGVRLAPLSPDIMIASSFLPASPPLHGNPADRLLIATARAIGTPIVTRDARILDYAAAGLVDALRC